MANSPTMPSSATDLGYGKLFAVLIRQRIWILSVLAGVLAIATPLSFRAKPTFESSMQLLVESNYQASKTQNSDLASSLVDSAVEIDYATQLKLMKSSELLQRAVDKVNSEYPEMTIEDIQKAIRLSQAEEDEVKTKIFEIKFVGESPNKTKKVLEAIQAVYLDYNLQKQQERLSRGLVFIDSLLPVARQELDKAQQSLRTFRQTYNLIDPNKQADEISSRLIEIQQSRQETRASLIATQSQIEAMETALGATSMASSLASARLSQSERYQALLDELQAVDKELVDTRLVYQDSSLNVIVVAEKRAEILNLLSVEAGRIVGTLGGSTGRVDGLTLEYGQYGRMDLELTADWIRKQTEQYALASMSQSLATAELELRTQLDKLPELIDAYNYLEPEIETNQATIEKLLTARQDLAIELAQGGFNWQVVEPPKYGEKIGPNYKRNLILNMIMGAALGVGAAFIRDAMSDVVHTPDDIVAQLKVPLIGSVSRPPSAFADTIEQQQSWLDEIALIYKKLTLRSLEKTWRSVLLTSALSKEGKSTLAIALSLSAFQAGDNVLLIDANLRNPQLHKTLQLTNEKGLGTVLQEELTEQWSLPIVKSKLGFNVLTAGPPVVNTLPLFSAKNLRQLMEKLCNFYDRVIIDTTTLSDSADVLELASVCDAICLVSRTNLTTEAALETLHTDIQGLPILGVVVGDDKAPEKAKRTDHHTHSIDIKASTAKDKTF